MELTHPTDPDKFLVEKVNDVHSSVPEESAYKMVWLKNASAHAESHVHLAPPYHALSIPGNGEGYVIVFQRDYLEEDDKEYALDVFQLFHQFHETPLSLDTYETDLLHRTVELMKNELDHPQSTYLILKALLKVLLLNLIRINQNGFLPQDLNQKRVYEFIRLRDECFRSERAAAFYAGRLGLSSKRLNQILKSKLGKTITQLVHDRLIVEAKRLLINRELTIKEIAYLLHFTDQTYFTRFFKQNTGYTPEMYIHSVKSQQGTINSR